MVLTFNHVLVICDFKKRNASIALTGSTESGEGKYASHLRFRFSSITRSKCVSNILETSAVSFN